VLKRLSERLWKISYGPGDDRLHDFYIPALEASVRFDRTTGFFSSAALAIAAAGVARLIQNDGRMRLLCGAQLSEADVEAVKQGADLKDKVDDALVGCLAEPSDQSMRARLEALAWLVAHERLEIRVVLPRDAQGNPLPASEAREYYHPKEGVFEDAEGNRLAFTGSSNDSENGWQWNYEVFSVYTTWPAEHGGDMVPALPQYVDQVERRFQRLWEGKEDSWIALDVPQAARDKLLTYCPATAPTADPLERPKAGKEKKALVPPEGTDPDAMQRERLLFRFLREAPYLPNADRIGIETGTVVPWPHQLRIVNEVVERYPANYLFCDEVGLGKTIEAGLALRQLVISGRVRRALLLVPKSVLRQWQEELYEKFALNVPRYDGGVLKDVFERDVAWSGGSVWSACPLLLASSQLAKRRERQGELLTAEPWDLVIVDEAHHARRRDFLDERCRPNRLLELLSGPAKRQGLKDRTRCLYLLTATPMQVHPVEVWDLLKILGLGGKWGALQENFVEFFTQLRNPFRDRDWPFILSMVRDYLAAGGVIEPAFAEAAQRELGPVDWNVVRELPNSSKPRTTVAQLNRKQQAYLHELVRQCTPLRRFVWRNTRGLLRKYQEKGLLAENVPRRKPKNEWIELKEGPRSERELYERIDEYISDFYQKYEAERKGLGFVMTVYRRRLTSSFHALQKSLERRKQFLMGIALPAGGLTDDDLEQEDLDLDVTEELTDEERARFRGELEYIDGFLHDLKELGSDSKLERLFEDLRYFFDHRDRVIIFTQYTDTMDYLREQLRQVYGYQVACYSGRGGEQWDGVAWMTRPKEELKAAFTRGDEVKILLCTESASEGLNLQTCGVLINYDLPWNPMRVEQRIGRIDRIGQKYEEVWIRNYFFEGTVEAIVYQRLSDRIDWFEDVVGQLQPILHQVARTIENVAMLRGKERKKRLDEEIAAIREQVESRELSGLDLDSYVDDQVGAVQERPVPVTLQQLERILVESKSVGGLFEAHPEIAGAHMLSWNDQQVPVTFDRSVFDKHPNSVQLLTYGNPLLDEILASVPEPDGPGGPRGGIGFLASSGHPPVSVCVRGAENSATSVRTVTDLQELLAGEQEAVSSGSTDAPVNLLKNARQSVCDGMKRVEETRKQSELLSLREEARQVLVRTALVYLAEAQKPELFDDLLPYGFGEDAVLALADKHKLYKALLKIAGNDGLACDPTDPYFLSIQGLSAENLKRKKKGLADQGYELARKYLAATDSNTGVPAPVGGPVRVDWYAMPGPADAAAVNVLPFRVLSSEEVKPFENAIPLYDLKVAAGLFSEEQSVTEVAVNGEAVNVEDYTWIEVPPGVRPSPDLFVSQVIGESMNRRIPNGAYCLFRFHPKGTRQGKVVLAQHRDIHDADLGGHYTVKVYESEKVYAEDGTWHHSRITLRPDTTAPGYEPIIVEDAPEGEFVVVAELVKALGMMNRIS